MNVALLEGIKAHILAEPQHFFMFSWHCGSTHCIGGYAAVLSGWRPESNSMSCWTVIKDETVCSTALAAIRALDIDDDMGDRLFDVDQWPDDLSAQYLDTDGESVANPQAERARIAAERIDRFIATGGAE